MEYLIALLLLAGSGLFSGLTIGLSSLSKEETERLSYLGNEEATKVLKFLKDPNLLLVSLVFGNTVVNVGLTNYLGSIMGSGIAVIFVATFLIMIFGEIVPAALITKYALKVGAKTSPLVEVIIWLFYPVSKPISIVLNKVLKRDLVTVLKREEISYIIDKQTHSEFSDIDVQDSNIIKGVLSMNRIVSAKVATKRRDVFSIKYDNFISLEKINKIKEEGYSRIPVVKDKRVIGIINVKQLLGLKEEKLAVDIMSSDKLLNIDASVLVDDALRQMIQSHIHIAIINKNENWLGILTMEDILEVMFQEEIYDETDILEKEKK